MVDGPELTRHHNDGEKDATKGEYHQPFSIGVLDIIMDSDATVTRHIALNDAYDKGYKNADKQR